MEAEPYGRGRGRGRGGREELQRCVSWRRGPRTLTCAVLSRHVLRDAGRQVGGGRRESEREREKEGGGGEEGTLYHVTGAARPGVSVWRRLR